MKFLTRSLLILLALYGLVFAIGDAYLARSGAPLWLAIVFAVGLVGLQYLAGPSLIEWTMDISWVGPGTEIAQANREFIERLCAERGLKVPRIGIIYSGTPNAFSFGHTPGDARVVVTTGLLDVLTPEEANAVFAHEIGHIEHWDFAVMTVAALAPLLLYQLYVFTRNINNVRAVAYAAYLCYWVSQFIVLLLNRTREYFADHYAAEVTRSPDALSSALVKIAYGMIRADGKYQETMATGTKDQKAQWRRERRLDGGLAVMGISNLHSGAAWSPSCADPSEAANVMRWDLVNPWARVYEMNSTHPLTALRVRELNQQAAEMHQASQYSLPVDQRVRWGAFPIEVFIWAAPFVCGILAFILGTYPAWSKYPGLDVPPNVAPILVIATGVLWMVRVLYRYRGDFQPATIGALIEDLEVSQMRPRAVQLKGKIVGRGLPGAFWSPDLVLQDATGILFVLYRQSIPFARFIFAMGAVDGYIGQEVTIDGWFRRGLTPYVEMSRVTGADLKTHRTYSRWVQYALAAVATAAGWLWLTGRL